jgi:hypothetical protein
VIRHRWPPGLENQQLDASASTQEVALRGTDTFKTLDLPGRPVHGLGRGVRCRVADWCPHHQSEKPESSQVSRRWSIQMVSRLENAATSVDGCQPGEGEKP